MRPLRRTLLATLVLALAAAAPARAVTPPAGFRDTLVCANLNMPVAMAFVPGPAAKGWRLLVAEQAMRRLQLVVNGVPAPLEPIGEVSEVEWQLSGERGLLSLAVDPRWPAAPYVYVHYTSFGVIHLVRYRMSGDVAWAGNGVVSTDTSSKMVLLADVPDVNPNHNGGCLRFGPDGMLYFSTGDDQQGCPAQDNTSLAGKVLRLDVTRLPASGRGPALRADLAPADNPYAASPDSNARLVWARGLRNPFRMHVDPANGALFVADVGQVTYEEVNRLTGPANLGWPWYENTVPYSSCVGAVPSGLTFPIATLVNPPNASIVSLGVYRAPAAASNPYPSDYDGDYFYSDYFSGAVRRLGWNGASWVLEPAAGQPAADAWGIGAPQVVDGAIGPDGSLWYLLHGINYGFYNGEVRRIVYVGDALAGVEGATAGGVRLAVPHPNPARGEVALAFTLAAVTDAELAVFDLAGRRVAVLAQGPQAAGEHHLRWDGRGADGRRAPAGVYRVRLRAGVQSRERAAVLLR